MGFLDDWGGMLGQQPQQPGSVPGSGGILGGLGGHLNNAMNDPLFMMGLSMIGTRKGKEQEAMQNAMQMMMMQKAFGTQRDDKKKAEERDARDFGFRQTEAARSGSQFNQSQAQAKELAERSHGLQEKGLTLRSVPEGFEMNPETPGALRPKTGGPADPAYKRLVGDRQAAPAGYMWNDPNNPAKGMIAIPGGPGEKVDSEVAGRIGLARSFLGQLPSIKERVSAGEMTGPIDAISGLAGSETPSWLGGGNPGELRRQIDSGAEALLRNLTGAGMSQTEAKNYVRRYQFSATDTAKTALSKLDQLERELTYVVETVSRGRGGVDSIMGAGAPGRPSVPGAPQAPGAASAATPDMPKPGGALPDGGIPGVTIKRIR